MAQLLSGTIAFWHNCFLIFFIYSLSISFQNIGPKWIVYVLAGTYWRIFGNPQNGINCFKWALSTVPSKHEDVVLTNLAGLLYKSGAIDDALALMKMAYKVNSKDPDTNFFMANLLTAKGNLTGSLTHYKKSLHMRPNYAPASQFILIPACELKFKTFSKVEKPAKNAANCDTTEGNCLNPQIADDVEDKDGLILCKNGHCKSVTPEEFLAQAFDSPDITLPEPSEEWMEGEL